MSRETCFSPPSIPPYLLTSPPLIPLCLFLLFGSIAYFQGNRACSPTSALRRQATPQERPAAKEMAHLWREADHSRVICKRRCRQEHNSSQPGPCTSCCQTGLFPPPPPSPPSPPLIFRDGCYFKYPALFSSTPSAPSTPSFLGCFFCSTSPHPTPSSFNLVVCSRCRLGSWMLMCLDHLCQSS